MERKIPFPHIGKMAIVLSLLAVIYSGFDLTKVFASGGWTQIDANSEQNGGMACAFDTLRNRGVRFGGDDSSLNQHNRTYEWTGNAWQLVASSGPPPRVNSAMAFDSSRGQAIIFGGWVKPDNYRGDTWFWNGASWNQATVTGPHARGNHTMAYDSARGKVVLFGDRKSVV